MYVLRPSPLVKCKRCITLNAMEDFCPFLTPALSPIPYVRWQVGQFIGMMIFGRYADLVGRRPAFTSYGLLTAGAVACLAFRWPYLSAHPQLFWTVMFCLGLGSGCTGGLGALMAELFPTEIRTLAMGRCYLPDHHVV